MAIYSKTELTPEDLITAPIVMDGDCLGVVVSAERGANDTLVCEILPDPFAEAN